MIFLEENNHPYSLLKRNTDNFDKSMHKLHNCLQMREKRIKNASYPCTYHPEYQTDNI